MTADDELLDRVQSGDEKAFLELYHRYHTGIYRFALRIGGSVAIAEDVTQEVFMSLVRKATRFDSSRGALGSYLYGIARNQLLRRLEREKSYVQIGNSEVETADHGEHPALFPDPLGDLTQAEAVESLRNAILTLPVRYREVIELCELQEMSYAAAAGILECPEGTVRSRLHRARALLLDKMREKRTSPATFAEMRSGRCLA